MRWRSWRIKSFCFLTMSNSNNYSSIPLMWNRQVDVNDSSGINENVRNDGNHLPTHHGFDFVGHILPMAILPACDPNKVGTFSCVLRNFFECHLWSSDSVKDLVFFLVWIYFVRIFSVHIEADGKAMFSGPRKQNCWTTDHFGDFDGAVSKRFFVFHP